MDSQLKPTESLDEILIVEDSATQAERLKHILEQSRYRFATARNGREALARIAVQIPALVISDVVMPEMDGYQLCRHLKQDPKLRKIPVILLTSLNDPIDVVRGLECGADNFIFKPYDERYLISRVVYILANRHLREAETALMGVEVFFSGQKFFITSDRLQILNLLLSTYETAVERNRELAVARDNLCSLNESLEVKVAERTAALQQEIVERKQAEAYVRAQAELLNKARDAIIAVDWDHRVTYWNASAERLYGWLAADALGRRMEDLRLTQPTAELDKTKAELLAQGEWRGDYSIVTKDGDKRHVEGTWSLVRDAGNGPHSILIINTDITVRKQLEADLLRAQRMDGIGMLAGGVAHDLNNALAPILMAAELLQSSRMDAQERRLLDMIQTGAKRGAAMVRQVLTFAKGAGGQRGHIQIKHLLREMEDLCRQTFPKTIEVRCDKRNDLWPIIADSTLLHQVLLNLCVNARDAMPAGGLLTLAAENVQIDEGYVRMSASNAKPGAFVVLTVADTGIGMTTEVCARIFDPFFTTKTEDKGTGLGLATVRIITEKHGGFVTVKSAPGLGTEFKVHLPAEVSAIAPAAPDAMLRPMGRGELILVVDDEAAIRNIAAQTLVAFGYQVLTAADGAEAIAQAAVHRDRLKLMITDLAMPVMDGMAAIQAVARLTPHVRIITTSGMDADPAPHSPVPAATGPHLNKPYSADQLLQVVHDVLGAENRE